MKKFLQKTRVLFNLWSLRKQIRVTEILLDNIEDKIKSVRPKVDLVQDFIKDSGVQRELRDLEGRKRALSETLDIYRGQARNLRDKLAG